MKDYVERSEVKDIVCIVLEHREDVPDDAIDEVLKEIDLMRGKEI